MPSCAAYGCTNRPGKKINGISFHRFPKDPTVRQAWVIACRRINWLPSKVSVLCSEHFSEDQIDRTSFQTVHLKEKAVPTIFSYQKDHFEESQYKLNRIDWKKLLKKTAVPTLVDVNNPSQTLRDNHTNGVRERADREPGPDSRLFSCHFKDGKKVNKPTIFSYCEKERFNFPSPEKKVKIPLCKSRSDRGWNKNKDGTKISFHEFPKDFSRRTMWILAIRRKGKNGNALWVPSGESDRAVVCSRHFTEEDYKGGLNVRCLKPNAVPSIFPEFPVHKQKQDTSSKMLICCVPLCNSHGGKKSADKDGNLITFHELPSDSKRRELWMKAMKNQEGIPIKFWEPIKKADKSVICSLHFQPNDFVSGVKFRSLLPEAVPSIFPIYKSQKKKIIKRKNTVTEEKDVPVPKIPCEEPVAAENSSSNHAENLVKDSSDFTSENTGSFKKDTISPKKKNFGFSKLHKSLSSVQKPNQYWGVTPTDKFIIFSMWNDKYIPEKRVVIEQNLNVKVFLGELEINTMNLMEFTCPDDVSNLLDKVDSINYSGKSLAINDIN